MEQSRILIVEDENIVALDIEMRLQGLGYQIIGTASTGERAIELALEIQPDLILMDINLRGEMDGVEAARQIKEFRDIPIVFLTAYADDTTFQRAVITGPFAYVLKPFDEKELQMSIEVALYRHQMEKNLREVAAENERLHKEIKMHADELERRISIRTAQLAKAHDRLQLILDTVDQAIYFIDTNNAILYMNPATERITGYELDQVVGKTIALWRGTTPTAVIEQLEQALSNGQSWRGDIVNRRQDGIYYDAELRIVPLLDAEDRVEGFVITQRNISDQKELQRLKAQFVFRIGHELRTPLTNFSLYLDLLERGGAENHDKYITILRQESKRLGKLILGFLEISSLDSAVDLPILEPVDVNAMLRDEMTQTEPRFLSKSLIIDSKLAVDLPLASANQQLLKQAFSHLIDNAILYAPENSHISIITAVQTKKDDEWITISIDNTCLHISPEEQNILFDRFYRGEAAKHSNTFGAGLGLAFCKESLEKQGGFITVTLVSESNISFTIWLKKSTHHATHTNH